MLVKDVQKVYYVKDGNYFNVPHLSGDIDNYDFPKNVVENHDIKIFKQCLDGRIEKILNKVTLKRKLNFESFQQFLRPDTTALKI